jgi:hypothetical protein
MLHINVTLPYREYRNQVVSNYVQIINPSSHYQFNESFKEVFKQLLFKHPIVRVVCKNFNDDDNFGYCLLVSWLLCC